MGGNSSRRSTGNGGAGVRDGVRDTGEGRFQGLTQNAKLLGICPTGKRAPEQLKAEV